MQQDYATKNCIFFEIIKRPTQVVCLVAKATSLPTCHTNSDNYGIFCRFLLA